MVIQGLGGDEEYRRMDMNSAETRILTCGRGNSYDLIGETSNKDFVIVNMFNEDLDFLWGKHIKAATGTSNGDDIQDCQFDTTGDYFYINMNLVDEATPVLAKI